MFYFIFKVKAGDAEFYNTAEVFSMLHQTCVFLREPVFEC